VRRSIARCNWVLEGAGGVQGFVHELVGKLVVLASHRSIAHLGYFAF